MHLNSWLIIWTVAPSTVSEKGLRVGVPKLSQRLTGCRKPKIKENALKQLKYNACMLLYNNYICLTNPDSQSYYSRLVG